MAVQKIILSGCVVAIAYYALLIPVPSADASQVDIEFSNFTVGETFPNSSLPTTITADGVNVELSKYNNSSVANGRIVDAPLFGSANNALFLAANLRAEIVLPAVSTGGFFFFRNQGGTNLLVINGQSLNFTNSALAGSDFGTLGGVSIHSSLLSGSYRSVKLDGLINSLAFIGQELTIDSVQLGIGLPGDHNLDGTVDAADYVVWRKTDSGNSRGYTDWRANFGEGMGAGGGSAGASPSQTGVPEPATAAMLIPATAGWCLRRRRAA